MPARISTPVRYHNIKYTFLFIASMEYALPFDRIRNLFCLLLLRLNKYFLKPIVSVDHTVERQNGESASIILGAAKIGSRGSKPLLKLCTNTV